MKNSLTVLLFLLSFGPIRAQNQLLTILVEDSLTNTRLFDFSVKIECDFVKKSSTKSNLIAISPADSACLLEVSKPFYKSYQIRIGSINGNVVRIALSPKTLVTQEVMVQNLQADEKLPISQRQLNSAELRKQYYGADVPTLLNSTPSINMYSDAGNGMGYSYFRMRGIDQSRINFTINGIPINDPENQGFFFNNFADLVSNAQNIQIQRGAGLSANGTASFGGSVNLITKELSDLPSFELQSGLGSFSSSRITTKYQTGILANKWAFGGRISQLKSNGYRENSGMEVQSYDASAGYYGKSTLIKFQTFGGFSRSNLSYLGADKGALDSNHRFNPFQNGEQDAFRQHFNQLQILHRLSDNWSIQGAAYAVFGGAPRFQFLFPAFWQTPFSWFNMPNPDSTNTLAGDMMTNYRLKQRLLGAYGSVQFKTQEFDLSIGFHANQFASDHFMEIDWGRLLPNDIKPGHRVYFNTGKKQEASVFARFAWQMHTNFSWFTELQLRQASFHYQEQKMAIRESFGSVEPMDWLFFNPRTGFRYRANAVLSFYSILGRTSREPTRFDYFQDDFATRPGIRKTDLKHEQVTDLELGLKLENQKGSYVKVNGFWMNFRNQIVGTGQLNVFGTPINTNVASSRRLGLEIESQWWLSPSLRLTHTLAWMKSEIKEIAIPFFKSDFSGDTTLIFRNKPALLSPELIGNLGLEYAGLEGISAGIFGRYTSLQYLDNTGSSEVSLPEFWFLDFRASADFKKWLGHGAPTLRLAVNNLTNRTFSNSGSVAAFSGVIDEPSGRATSTPLFFPAATRNWFVTLDWRF